MIIPNSLEDAPVDAQMPCDILRIADRVIREASEHVDEAVRVGFPRSEEPLVRPLQFHVREDVETCRMDRDREVGGLGVRVSDASTKPAS
jgi:hypothetical protein